MTHEKESNVEKAKDELDVLKDDIRALQQELDLQKANWLYSHHKLYSVCFGIVYGGTIAGLHYLILGILGQIALSIRDDPSLLHGLAGNILAVSTAIIFLGVPTIAFLPMVLILKAPRFALRSMFFYMVSFFSFSCLIYYVDPWSVLMYSTSGADRASAIIGYAFVQVFSLTFLVLFAPQIAQRCGYRHVLEGSPLSFEINANSTAVSEQLDEVEQDFNLTLDRARSRPNAFFFFRGSPDNKKMVLQIFLRPKDGKTDLLVIMHSIVNDIPLKVKHAIAERLGAALMRWLEQSGSFTVVAAQKKNLDDEVIKESKASFLRQSVGLPSKKVIGEFVRDHWKDIVIIISLIIAFLAWVFPFR